MATPSDNQDVFLPVSLYGEAVQNQRQAGLGPRTILVLSVALSVLLMLWLSFGPQVMGQPQAVGAVSDTAEVSTVPADR